MGSVFGKRERFGMCHRQGRYPGNLVGAPLGPVYNHRHEPDSQPRKVLIQG